MFRLIFFIAFALTLVPIATAQADTSFDPSGFWRGAIVKQGSVFPVELTIERSEKGYEARTRFPDWLNYLPRGTEIVRVTETGLIIEDLLDGDAVLQREPEFGQLIGPIGEDGTRTLHLKRMPPPPKPLVETVPASFLSADGTALSGALILPAFGGTVAGMVMVRGRGCASRIESKARFFAQYGIAVLTYDKRGSGSSEGDCTSFTFDELVEDATAAFDYLAAHPRTDPERVGFQGESAGAWTVQAATERRRATPEANQPAFIVTWIGPTTSILQQQISSAYTYGEAVDLDRQQQDILVQVTRIIADEALTDDDAYHQLADIRVKAEAEGWLSTGFGSDDIPATRQDMEKLWLRRFRYDPASFFEGLGELPYLGIFGGKDPIVPVDENVAMLGGLGPNVEAITLPASGHGYDFDEAALTLPSSDPFWMFEGPDAGFPSETIQFLRERGFLVR